ncbi:MAG TPA: DinB family protein [Vicinamibacteria bacterium]|nr:DinB family protein [Vicinamibacteria bacterium]
MQEEDRRQHLETLAATPGRLKAALAGVSRKLSLWRPAPGKWSILEIVCHLRDMEREAYLARYRRILAEENPRLPDVDGDVLAIERDYRSQRLAAVLQDWSAARKETLKLLKGVKGPAWERVGTHETAGRLAMADLLRRHAVGNDEAHLGQIDATKRRFELLGRLAEAPKALAATVKGLDPEAARRRPADGKWSILENACHLRDIELVYAERFTRTAFQDRPSFWMLDNDRSARELRYDAQDLKAVAGEFAARRADTLTLLRALPHAAWRRTGIHPKRGELSLEALAEHLARHDESHLGRIRALRGA